MFRTIQWKVIGRFVGENLLAGVCLGAKGCALLELGTWILRQICHHRLFVNVWICHFVGFDKLTNAEPVVGQAHGFSSILKGVFRIPISPVRTQAGSDVVDQSTDGLTVVPV